MVFEKLVRDKIPEIIEQDGGQAVTRVLSDEEYRVCLEKKLDEEAVEYHESRELDELADVLEVVYALAQADGHTVEELLSAYQRKHEQRGGFSQKLFLIERR